MDGLVTEIRNRLSLIIVRNEPSAEAPNNTDDNDNDGSDNSGDNNDNKSIVSKSKRK